MDESLWQRNSTLPFCVSKTIFLWQLYSNLQTVSLGKSSRAALELIYAQNSVLLEDLRQDGGEGAFVSVNDVLEGIPQPYQN